MEFGARAALSGVLIAGCLFATGLSATGPAPVRAGAPPEIPVLARIGPWPVASRPIGFDGRIWFANSVKAVNHNSADIYSYDPRSGALRLERHLFSQDAGQPLAWNGLLYWHGTVCSTGRSRIPAPASPGANTW